jgi:hypothetical protein
MNNPVELGWTEYIESLNNLGFEMKMVSVDEWRKRLESVDETNALFPLRELYLRERKDLIDPESHAPAVQDASAAREALNRPGVSYLRDYTRYISTQITYLKNSGFLSAQEE